MVTRGSLSALGKNSAVPLTPLLTAAAPQALQLPTVARWENQTVASPGL